MLNKECKSVKVLKAAFASESDMFVVTLSISLNCFLCADCKCHVSHVFLQQSFAWWMKNKGVLPAVSCKTYTNFILCTWLSCQCLLAYLQMQLHFLLHPFRLSQKLALYTPTLQNM